jgi:hypothetical protein
MITSTLQETLFIAVSLMDRFMCIRALNVKSKKFTLVAATSLFMAAKYEERYPPSIGQFIAYSNTMNY